LKHGLNLLFRGFVDVACCRCVGKADWASEVAAVCNVDYCQSCVAFVFWANAAVLRASLDGLGVWVIQAFSFFSVLFRSFVLFVVAPVNLVVFAVFWTGLFDVDLVILLVDCCVQNSEAFGADAFGFFYCLRPVSPLMVVKPF
jgi:hypothetical protein